MTKTPGQDARNAERDAAVDKMASALFERSYIDPTTGQRMISEASIRAMKPPSLK